MGDTRRVCFNLSLDNYNKLVRWSEVFDYSVNGMSSRIIEDYFKDMPNAEKNKIKDYKVSGL